MGGCDSSPLITVIVTFYNLEQFARDCVRSIALQQGFSDYEVLLVDDGSTDSTLEVLKSLAKEYQLCRVIEQTNSGVSVARNRGVREARGEYVTFIDGDDVVAPSYLNSLITSIESTQADMSIATPTNIAEGSKLEELVWDSTNQSNLRRYVGNEAMLALLYETITEAPWGKLAKRDLYCRMPFPAGRRYEDVAIAGEHIKSCRSVVAITAPTYGYRMRKGSVVHPTNAALSQAADFIWAIDEFLGTIEPTDDHVARGLLFRMALEYLRLRVLLRACKDTPAKRFERDVTGAINDLVPIVLSDSSLRFKDRLRLQVFQINPHLYDMLLCLYDHYIKGV